MKTTTPPVNTIIRLLAQQAVHDHLSKNPIKKQQDNQNRPNRPVHKQVRQA